MDNNRTGLRMQVSDAPIGAIQSIDRLSSGYSSMAYRLTTDQGQFIALTPKDSSVQVPDYAYYYAILETLGEINYQFAPQAVYLNPERSVIVMTSVVGESLKWINDASDDQQKQTVDILVTALLDLRAVSFDHCAEKYRQLSGRERMPATLQGNVKRFMTDWYTLAQSGQPDPYLTKWGQPKVALCEEFVKHLAPGDTKVFVHGDTSEGNILLAPDLQLHLIDWDTSNFNQFPAGWDDFGLAYLMNHVPLFQKFRSLVLSMVSERGHIDADELDKTIMRAQEFIKIGDFQWAYMMNARAAAGQIEGDPEKFLKIAHQRMNDYQKLFANHSFLEN